MTESASTSSRAATLAMEHFAAGYNCAEAALLGVTQAMGLSQEAVPRIATGFGGGIARRGEVCGALTGAAMAVGLALGRSIPEDKEARARTDAALEAVLDGFARAHGTLLCRDLIGCDLSTEEGRARAVELRTHQDVCPKFVALAARLAADQIAADR